MHANNTQLREKAREVAHQIRVRSSIRTRLLDAADAIARRETPSVPPRRLRQLADGGNYAEISAHWAERAQTRGGLGSSGRVLDVGSGTGRIALGFIDYLSGGSYDGLEIVRPAVRWCQRAFSPYPNFRFHHFDLRNGMYNPGGRLDPDTFAFQFPDESFDLAILTSVFTHLPESTVDHYLAELERVLVPDGRALITCFLLDRESEAGIERGESSPDISHPYGSFGTKAADPDMPERAVGHPAERVLKLVDQRGFELAEPIHHGTWRSGMRGSDHQDLLVLRKS